MNIKAPNDLVVPVKLVLAKAGNGNPEKTLRFLPAQE